MDTTPTSNRSGTISNKEKEQKFRLTELQHKELGLTCNKIIQMYRPILLDGWNSTVDQCLLPLLNAKMSMSDSANTETGKMIREMVRNQFLRDGRFDLILFQAKDHLNDYMFSHLEDDDESTPVVPDDEAKLMREIEALEEEIIRLRVINEAQQLGRSDH